MVWSDRVSWLVAQAKAGGECNLTDLSLGKKEEKDALKHAVNLIFSDCACDPHGHEVQRRMREGLEETRHGHWPGFFGADDLFYGGCDTLD
jgi:hypothetical protein